MGGKKFYKHIVCGCTGAGGIIETTLMRPYTMRVLEKDELSLNSKFREKLDEVCHFRICHCAQKREKEREENEFVLVKQKHKIF